MTSNIDTTSTGMDDSPAISMDCSPAVSMDCSPAPIIEETETTVTNINTSIIRSVKKHKQKIIQSKVSKVQKKVTKKKISKITKKKSAFDKNGNFRKVNTAKGQKKEKKVYPVVDPPSADDLSLENKYVPKEKRFRAWKCDDYVIKILKKRGWTYVGEPSDAGRDDYPESMKNLKNQGKLDMAECLYWADDDDARILQGMANNHVISCLPNADKALTKVYQQKMFNEYEWFPTCWTLPKEKEAFLKYVNENPESWYICKPRNSYGGFGMCVYKANSDDFKKCLLDRKCEFVVQEYMHNPYLFAGIYKFHFRCYMLVSNARPLKSYLWKDTQIQFSTHKFDITQIGSNFNKYSHITNYKVNNEKKNRSYVLQDKPGIGKGSEWPISMFFDYMKEHDKEFNEDKFWADLTSIATTVAEKLVYSPHISRSFEKKGALVTNHFEIYGLDILMDENRNIMLTEANTQPGLDWTDPKMSDGTFNTTIVKANDITEGIVNDSITKLGLDDFKVPQFGEFILLKTNIPEKK